MRLQKKTFLLLTPTIVLPMLVLGVLAYIQLKQTSEQKTLGQMSTLLEQIQLQVDSYVETAETNIELFSNANLIQRYMLADDELERYELLQAPVLTLLSSYQKGYPSYYEVRILLPDGYEDTRSTITPLANVTEEEGESEFFKKLVSDGGKAYSSFVVNPDNGEYCLLIAKPIRIKDPAVDPLLAEPRLLGYLVITADLKFLTAQQQQTKIGQGGGIFFTESIWQKAF